MTSERNLSFSKLKSCIVTIALLFTVTSTQAIDSVTLYEVPEILNCQERHKTIVSYSRCLDSVVKKYHRELKTWETNIELKLKDVAKVNGRHDSIMAFKGSVKEFESFRKRNCNWQYLAMLPDVPSAGIITKECDINMTIQRIGSLKEISAFDFG